MLDIGCGPGFFSVILSGEGHQVTGIDCTDNMLEEARGHADRECLLSNGRSGGYSVARYIEVMELIE